MAEGVSTNFHVAEVVHGLHVNTSLSSKPIDPRLPSVDSHGSHSVRCVACDHAATAQQEWMRGSLPLIALTAAAFTATYMAVLAG